MAVIAIVTILAETSLVKFAHWRHILLRDIMLVDTGITECTLTVFEVVAMAIFLLEFCEEDRIMAAFAPEASLARLISEVVSANTISTSVLQSLLMVFVLSCFIMAVVAILGLLLAVTEVEILAD